MGSIVISTNLTLDGTSQDPTGEEGTEHGGWFLSISGEDRSAWEALLLDETKNLSAYLIGGRSYEWFAQRWVSRKGELADLLNGKPKHVVRSQAGRTDWGPTTVIAGDLGTAVADLKASIDGEIVVYASFELVQSLLELGLVDEVRVFVFPQVAGGGGRLFRDLSSSLDLELTRVEQVGEQLVHLCYDVRTTSA
jgi:dihydrofolate reductase